MRYPHLYLLIASVLLITTFASAQGTLSPAVPVVNQGVSITISCTANCGTGGAWTLPGGAGTLSGATATSVTYTAPATVTPQQSIGGYQLHPNNHVFNTRVDSLPLRSDSAALMAGAGTLNLIYREISFPVNYCNASTPLQSMVFLYTPGNNGNFQIPAYPAPKIEGGWFTRWDPNRDHHLICVDATNGTMQEEYQHRKSLTTTAASVTGNVATLTFASDPSVTGAGFVVGQVAPIDGFAGADIFFNQASGVALTAVTTSTVSYALTHANASASSNGVLGTAVDCPSAGLDTCNSASGIRYLNSTYNLPNTQGGATDAGGLELSPLILRLQEMRQAIANGTPINHALRMTLQNGYLHNAFLWPGTASSSAGGGANFYGERVRLKASYNCAALSSIAQILCTQLKNYGLIIADGGTGWSVISEATKWPQDILAAMSEMEAAAIQGSTNFEVVDESGIEISATSGETTNSRETVTYTSTTGVATVDVALMGVAVNLPNDQMYFQAGAPALQLTAFSNIGSVTWSMNNPVGTLTSGGLYTPPTTDQTFAIASSHVNTNSSAVVENRNVAATGSYAATVAVTGSAFIYPSAFNNIHGEWIEYMLALKSASSPYGAPAIQSKQGASQTCSNACTDGFTGNAATGNLGVISVYDQSDATATVSSATFACGTLTLDSNSPKRGANTSMWVYTVQLTSGTCGANSITITFNHSITASISATEFHNMAAASVVDCSVAGTGNGYLLNSGACTTGNASDVLYAAGGVLVGNAQPSGIGFNPGGNYTTVTATSTTNAAIAASMTLTVLPTGTIRIYEGQTVPFTDNEANVWAATTGDDGGQYGCCLDARGAGSWPATNDIWLYESSYEPWTGDLRYDLHVPNGAYQVTAKFATTGGVGSNIESLEAQGIVFYPNVDINVAAGGTFKPVDFVLNPTVTTGLLSFVIRGITGLPIIASLQISRTGVAVATTLTPGMKVTSGVSIK